MYLRFGAVYPVFLFVITESPQFLEMVVIIYMCIAGGKNDKEGVKII